MNNEFENKEIKEQVIETEEAGFSPEASEEASSAYENNAQAPVENRHCASHHYGPMYQGTYPPQGEVPPYTGFNVTHNVKRKPKLRWIGIVALVLICSLVFGVGFGISRGISTRFAMSALKIPSTKVELSKAEKSSVAGTSDIAIIAEECMPSIVAITNRGVSDVETFFGTYTQESTSTGSGIIIGKNDSELLIVTNYHVIANSKELSVVFSPVEEKLETQVEQSDSGEIKSEISILNDGSVPKATVKGYNSDKDLAVIAVKLEDIKEDTLSQIKIATIGDSSVVRPGDRVVAIGNALGYGQSVTTGIISAVNRKITMESSDGNDVVTNSFIQTDAAINQGNSGGALLDMEGNVIGINSVKIATTGVEGMCYAIPISDVENIIDELMLQETRNVVDEDMQGFLGITGRDVSASVSQMYKIPKGVFVDSVMEGLAADKAGIKEGYIICGLDGYSITAMAQLQDRLQYYKSGETVKIKVKYHEGSKYKEKELDITLSNRSEYKED